MLTSKHHHSLRDQVPTKVSWWRSIATIGIFLPLSVVPLLIERRLSNAFDEFCFGLAPRAPGQPVIQLTPGMLLVNNLLVSSTAFAAALAVKVMYGQRVEAMRMISKEKRWRMQRWTLPAIPPACVLGAVFTFALHRVRPLMFRKLTNYSETYADRALPWIALFTVPLEAVAEEYVFRGFVLQTVASAIAGTEKAFWISSIAQSGFFALIHASPDPWHNAYYVWAATVNALTTQITGGIEVASVFHAAFNLALFLPMIVNRNHSLLFDRFELNKRLGAPVLLLGMVASSLVPAWAAWWKTRFAHKKK